MKRKGESEIAVWGGIAAIALVFVCIGLWAWPTYKVWSSGMHGQALLRQAEQEKQIMIEQAKAEVESAKLRAEAIRIEGEMAQQFPEYRTQQFIGAFAEAMQNGSIEKIVYVPTEANIPIIEAKN